MNNNEIMENEVVNEDVVYEDENETGRGFSIGKLIGGLLVAALAAFGIGKLVKVIKNKRNKNNVETTDNNEVK